MLAALHVRARCARALTPAPPSLPPACLSAIPLRRVRGRAQRDGALDARQRAAGGGLPLRQFRRLLDVRLIHKILRPPAAPFRQATLTTNTNNQQAGGARVAGRASCKSDQVPERLQGRCRLHPLAGFEERPLHGKGPEHVCALCRVVRPRGSGRCTVGLLGHRLREGRQCVQRAARRARPLHSRLRC
jgi:hypothetical protein